MKTEHILAATIGISAFFLFVHSAQGATYRLSLDCGPFFKLNETATTQRCGDFCFLFSSAQKYLDAVMASFPFANVQTYIEDFAKTMNNISGDHCAHALYSLKC